LEDPDTNEYEHLLSQPVQQKQPVLLHQHAPVTDPPTPPRTFPPQSECWAENGPPRHLKYFTGTELTQRDEVYRLAFDLSEKPLEIQEEGLLAFVRGCDTIVHAPTNSGKSRIFTLFALWVIKHMDPEGIVLLIYPTLGLEEKQIKLLNAQYPNFHGTWYDTQGDTVAQQTSLAAGNHRVIGVSPEVATSEWFLKLLGSDYYKEHVKAIVVDEVHCLETWIFRVAFTYLIEVLKTTIRVLGVTGTLTKKAEKKVLVTLGLTPKKVYFIRRSIIKDNLTIEIRGRPGDSDTARRLSKSFLDPVLPMLRAHARGGAKMARLLIICKTTTMVNAVFHYLRDVLGDDAYQPSGVWRDYRDCLLLRVFSEHDRRVKDHVFATWVPDPDSHARILIGTSLLEMGHDFNGLYNLILIGLPSTLMHFRQGLGRAGRKSGEVAHALVLHNATDYEGVEQCLVDLVQEETECFNVLMYKEFGEKFDPDARKCACSNCCKRLGIPVVCGLLPPHVLPELPEPPTADALTRRWGHADALLAQLLASDINTCPPMDSNPWAAPLPPSQSQLQPGAGLEAGLCREYTDNYCNGNDMSVYLYDQDTHRSIVMQAIAVLEVTDNV
jgi:ATP-dependent DNA helicase RecQ